MELIRPDRYELDFDGELLSPQRKVEKALARQAAAELMVRGKTSQLIVHETSFAWAYIYHGDWVANCPQPDCGNVQFVCELPLSQRSKPRIWGDRMDRFVCGYCGHGPTAVQFPSDDAGSPWYSYGLEEAVDRRPIPHTRNWYPEGHPTAVAWGIPDGQTVEDLLRENEEHGL